MNFIRTLSPAFTPSHLQGKSTLLILREKIVQTFLLILAIGTITAYAIFFKNYIEQQAYFSLIGYSILTSLVIVLVLARDIPYFLRAGVILIGVLAISLLSFYQRGLAGDGRTFLLALSVLTILLASDRLGYVSVILNISIYALMAYLFINSLLTPTSANALNIKDTASWISGGVFFSFIDLVIVASVSFMINNLQKSLTQSAELARELGKERFTLQSRVEQRTKDLQQRLIQIRVASEISRAISSILDPQALLQTVVDLIQERFDLYYTGLFITDRSGYAVLRAGTGEAGRKMIASGHRLAIGSASMIGWCIANRTPRVALDVGDEAVRFNNPVLPNTRSEIAVPIISRGEALGALSIQSDQPNAFGEADILILQSIADSLAVAMVNARLFQQTQENLVEIRNLNKNYLQQAWSEVLDEYGELSCLVENPNPAARGKTHPIYIPIALRDQILGTLTLETESSELTPEEQAFVEAVTVQTALALENARLVEESQRRAQQEHALNDLTSEFSKVFSIDELLRSALKGISQLPSVAEVSVHLVPPEPTQTAHTVPGGYGKEHA